LSGLHYPFHHRTITISQRCRICVGCRKINLSTVFAGQNGGIKEVSDKSCRGSFMDYALGFFDHKTGCLGSINNPFEAKVLLMSPV
jgi:putative transposase